MFSRPPSGCQASRLRPHRPSSSPPIAVDARAAGPRARRSRIAGQDAGPGLLARALALSREGEGGGEIRPIARRPLPRLTRIVEQDVGPGELHRRRPLQLPQAAPALVPPLPSARRGALSLESGAWLGGVGRGGAVKDEGFRDSPLCPNLGSSQLPFAATAARRVAPVDRRAVAEKNGQGRFRAPANRWLGLLFSVRAMLESTDG